MARKRGGLAGVWDRNKGVIKTVAPIAAGFIPGVGPLVAAGLGAAMGGLDRPGKGGIGLDVGGAIKGGISGYGAGKMGQGVKGMFTAQMAKQSALKGAGQALDATKGMADIAIPGVPSGIGGAGSAASSAMPNVAGGGFDAAKYLAESPQAASRTMQLGKDVSTVNPLANTNKYADAAKKAGSFLGKNQEMIGSAAKGISNVMGAQAQGAAEADRLALEQSKFDYLKQQDTLEQEKRRRLAQLTGQMFMPQMANIYGSGLGNPAMTMDDYINSRR